MSMSWQAPIEGEEGFPVLPYADAETGRSSGWSGSDTSKERAHRRDEDGTTAKQQSATLEALNMAGMHGLTYRELNAALGIDHGSSSGVLSNLHDTGWIARLAQRRGRCKVYVALEYVNGRETEVQGRNKPELLPHNHRYRAQLPKGECPACDDNDARFPQ